MCRAFERGAGIPEQQREAALLPNGTLKAAKNTHLKALEGEAPPIPSSDGMQGSNSFCVSSMQSGR